ncbi:hypothetical protein RRG08_055719 [Elysia crispata]|uniref:Uncharacterized protein n=1 Tax=Elysia crispata TaxID=231223 RepID=A0AAE1B094_9GAST|nr:hypothetical protein RRG08_055719 [Elysia crispata]
MSHTIHCGKECQQIIYRGSLKYVTHYPLRKRMSADYLPRKPQVCHTLSTAEKNVSRLSTEEALSESHTIHCGKECQQAIYRGIHMFVSSLFTEEATPCLGRLFTEEATHVSADYSLRRPHMSRQTIH